MRVHLGTDHAGFEMKEYLKQQLTQHGYQVIDHGAPTYDAQDDYPVYCIPCAEAVVAEAEHGSLGIVLGGSGNGEQLAANKVTGARAILATETELAYLGRQHNNANIMALGGRFGSLDEAWQIVRTFLETPFSNDERHIRRLAMLADYEAKRG